MTRRRIIELVRAARFRHPRTIVFVACEDTPSYYLEGAHASIVRRVVCGEKAEVTWRDSCLISRETIADAIRKLQFAGYRVAIYEEGSTPDPLATIALKEFPKRAWLESDTDFLHRVGEWERLYRQPAMAFRHLLGGAA